MAYFGLRPRVARSFSIASHFSRAATGPPSKGTLMENQTRILIVEDEAVVAENLRSCLEFLGYEVVGIASSGEAALECAGREKPDLVLMDIELEGDMDGIAAAGVLAEGGGVPVIYLTGHPEGHYLQRARKTNPYGYLIKPFDTFSLKSAIEVALRKNESESRIWRVQELYTVLCGVNEIVVRSGAPETLLPDICRVLVEAGHFAAAWVGRLNPESGDILCVARHGAAEWLGWEHFHISGDSRGLSPAEACIRENQIVIADDLTAVDSPEGWRERHFGGDLRSAAAFPIQPRGVPAACLTVYSQASDCFQDMEVRLLHEVALNIAYSLEGMEIQSRRRFAEEALRASEQRYKHLLSSVSDYIYTVEIQDGRPISTTHGSGCESVTGYSPEEYTAHPFLWFEMIHPDDRAAVLEHARQAMRGETSAPLEHRLLHKDGSVRWVRNALVTRRGRTGEIIACDGLISDISSRKQAEEALQKSLNEIADLYNNAPCGYHSINPDCVFVQMNDTELSWLGYSREEVVGKMRFTDLLTDESREKFQQVFRQFQVTGRAEDIEYDFVRKDGGILPVLLTATAERDAFGNFVKTRTSVFDISEHRKASLERKRLEEQLIQAQKMESIGLLAGGVAHDFNNILAVILGHCDMMREDVEPGSLLEEELNLIIGAGERAKDLTRQLLAFSRKQVLQVKTIDLNKIIHNMDKLVGRLLGEDVEMRVETCPDPCFVNADSAQLDQVLMNLCVNARDAMPNGGTLTIRTGLIQLDENAVRDILSDGQPGHYVMLSVEDSGDGMDETTRRRIFDPFFTTKARGKGSGLGLATVDGIVRQHGGGIRVRSELGQGAVFEIFLPITQRIEMRAPEQRTRNYPRGNGEHILIMEDEAPLRRLFCLMLKRMGYVPLEVGSPEECFEIARSDERIDLLLTDVIMPVMNGRQIYDAVNAIRPGIRTIFMSGYTEDIIARHGVLETGFYFVAKPFTEEELGLKLREALRSEG